MGSNKEILFELLEWKRLNKTFSLQIKLPCNDYVGWNDYYTVYFISNGKVEKQNKFRRFVYNKGFYPFCCFMDKHELARASLNTFQYLKLDILNLKVIKIIE